MLSNYQIGGQALLQIFLLGQPEFRDKLAHSHSLEQLRQRVIASHHLEPMEEHEVEPYIVHRLSRVGWDGKPGFEQGAFAAFFRHSAGVPRRVNQLASRVLLHAAMEELDSLSAETVDLVAEDMADDNRAPEPVEEEGRVLHLLHSEVIDGAKRAHDFAFAPRVAALEARLDEQEVALRRTLTLLVDWAESGDEDAVSIRHNAA
jgi:hypothetical protein